MINDGPHSGKLCVVVDVVDQNRALVDCPNTNVPRHALNFKWMALTDLKVKLPRGARSKYVRKAFEDEQVESKWSQTAWAKRIARFQRRAELTDFERFKVKVLKQKKSQAVRREVNKLKKTT